MDEAQAVAKQSADEAQRICEEIRRISGGDHVTFGELVKDEVVEQTFEALMGTLKAARKKGLIHFEGELLLQGQHDAVVISILAEGAAPPAPAPAPAPAKRQGSKESTKSEEKFKVDTSYIAYRTGEVENLEPRRSRVAEALVSHSASVKKEEDGKWKVDTSYIGYRTIDPGNLTRKEEKQDDVLYAHPADKKYSHDELKVSAGKPADVDPAKREQYLSDSDFEKIFGMPLSEFQCLPKWKQQNAKKAKGLF